MLIVRPDFARRIDLPGAGPCPRPVDLDRARTGFSSLISLRVYSFAAGAVIDGEADADEVYVVLLRGRAEIVVSSDESLRRNCALARGGSDRAVYLPPHSAYRLRAVADCDIAYARAKPRVAASPETRGFVAVADRLDVVGHASGMNLGLAVVPAGCRVALADRQCTERFVHVRSDAAVTATMAGEPVGDWDTVVLDAEDVAVLEVRAGTAEILTVSACPRGDERTQSGNSRQGMP